MSQAKQYLDELTQTIERVDPEAIDRLSSLLFQAWRQDQQVIVLGNGGSAYTASHFVTDLVKTASVDGRPRLRAISVVDNYGLTTAIGNDIDYDETFVLPVETYARPGDVVIAISGSGTSANVVRAVDWARRNDCRTAALTGFDGGVIGGVCDVHVNVPSSNYGVIEDLHLSVGHMISQALKAMVADDADADAKLRRA